MNNELSCAIKRFTCGIVILAAAFVAVQALFLSSWYQSTPPPNYHAIEALQGWFGIQAVALAGFILTVVGIFFGFLVFFFSKEAASQADAAQAARDDSQHVLEEARELTNDLRLQKFELDRDRVILKARRQAAYDLYLCWSRELTADTRRATPLACELIQIGHLFESCAAPDDETQERAIIGLGGELVGVFAAPVRYFLEALEREDYYLPRSRARMQLARALGGGLASGAEENGPTDAAPAPQPSAGRG